MEFCVKLLSLPLWERGLKYACVGCRDAGSGVAPLVGAWIEIRRPGIPGYHYVVAPLMGA